MRVTARLAAPRRPPATAVHRSHPQAGRDPFGVAAAPGGVYGSTRFDDFVRLAGLTEPSPPRGSELVAPACSTTRPTGSPASAPATSRLHRRGRDLVPVLLALGQWSLKHSPEGGGPTSLHARNCISRGRHFILQCAAGHVGDEDAGPSQLSAPPPAWPDPAGPPARPRISQGPRVRASARTQRSIGWTPTWREACAPAVRRHRASSPPSPGHGSAEPWRRRTEPWSTGDTEKATKFVTRAVQTSVRRVRGEPTNPRPTPRRCSPGRQRHAGRDPGERRELARRRRRRHAPPTTGPGALGRSECGTPC